MSSTVLAPLAPSERIDSLDVLRGLALLGIALMNVEYFTAPLAGMEQGIAPGQRGLDWLADAFVYVFVRGKFWALFSLLFGMGFAIMLDRAQSAGRSFAPLYLRRTFGLLLIGLAHAWLIWAGDILVSYAVTAVALLLFRHTATGDLWKWGAGLWAVLVAVMLLGGATMMLDGDVASGPDAVQGAAVVEALRDAEVAAYSAGSYAEATAVRWRYFAHVLGLNVFLVPLVLGTFLLGAWLVRSGAIGQQQVHRRLWVSLVWSGGLAGLALTAASLAIDSDPGGTRPSGEQVVAMTLHMAGAPLMSLAYVAVVVLALHRATWLRVFAPAGRMALTQYLAQSVIGTLVFYGYGLGLWGEVPRAWQVLGVLLVFGAQLLVSHWWLGRFRYGPLEWLWRAFTYWQWPTMRRSIGVQ
ncbi:DUF418 domain-containing protein [Lysobacter sp. A378]